MVISKAPLQRFPPERPSISLLAAGRAAAERRVDALEGMIRAADIAAAFVDSRGFIVEIWRGAGLRGRKAPLVGEPADALDTVWPGAGDLVRRVLDGTRSAERRTGGVHLLARHFGYGPGRVDGAALVALPQRDPEAFPTEDSAARAAFVEERLSSLNGQVSAALFTLLRDRASQEAVASMSMLSEQIAETLDILQRHEQALRGRGDASSSSPETLVELVDRVNDAYGPVLAERGIAFGARMLDGPSESGLANPPAMLEAVDLLVGALCPHAAGGRMDVAFGLHLADAESGAATVVVSIASPLACFGSAAIRRDLRLRAVEAILGATVDVDALEIENDILRLRVVAPVALEPLSGARKRALRLDRRRVCTFVADPAPRDALAEVLRTLGTSVEVHGSVDAFSEALRHRAFDAVVVDVLNVGNRGSGLLRLVRSAEVPTAGAQCLAVVPDIVDPAVERHLARGYDALISWPPNANAVGEILDLVLKPFPIR